MKKFLILTLSVFTFITSFAQREVDRAGAQNTVVDQRLRAKLNFVLPTFADTTAANLQKGNDTCGALIYTTNLEKLYSRQCNPRKWIEVGSGAVGTALDPLGMAALSISGNGSADNTALINSLLALSTIPEIHFDGINGVVKISGTVTVPAGKRLVFNNNCKLKGTNSFVSKLDGGIIECDYLKQCFDSSLQVINLDNSTVSVRWFGAKSDFRDDGNSLTWTNNQPFFKRTLDAVRDVLPNSNTNFRKQVYVPARDQNKYYRFDSTWVIDASATIYGDGIFKTVLSFPANMRGIHLLFPDLATFTYKGGQYQILRDMELMGVSNAQYDGVSHGVYVQTTSAKVLNVKVSYFNGDGICVRGESPTSNANNASVEDCISYNNSGSGFLIDGPDGNNVIVQRCDGSYNARWGFWESSFLGCLLLGNHATANINLNNFNRSSISRNDSQFYVIKDIVWRVSHNGQRYHCIAAHNKNPESITEPGAGSSWHTYWVLDGAGGPNSWYANWDNRMTNDFLTGPVMPHVTANWDRYYEFRRAGSYDPGTDTNPDAGVVKKWTDTIQLFTGGHYRFDEGNANGAAVGNYAEYDVHVCTNEANTTILGGTLALYGRLPGAIGTDQGVISQANIKLMEPTLHMGWQGVHDSSNHKTVTGFFDWVTVDALSWDYIRGGWSRIYTSGYVSDPLQEFFTPAATGFASRQGLSAIPTHGVVTFPEGFSLGRNGNITDERQFFAVTSIPTTGEHSAGQIALNMGTDSAIVFWKCTLGGTPGTWQPIKSSNAGVSGTDANAWHKTVDAWGTNVEFGISDNNNIVIRQNNVGRMAFLSGVNAGKITYGGLTEYGAIHNFTGSAYFNNDLVVNGNSTFVNPITANSFYITNANNSLSNLGNNTVLVTGTPSGGFQLYVKQGQILAGTWDNTALYSALHGILLNAGTTTEYPLKFQSGTALTTPQDGAVEYHSSHLYFTIGSTRYQLDQQATAGMGSAAFITDADYTVAAGVTHVILKSQTTARTITLPSAGSSTNRVIYVYNAASTTANLSATIRINPSTTTTTIGSGNTYQLISDGSEWWKVEN
jgi:hypothetical protein